MPDQDELPFSVALSERVSVEFALVKRDDGRYRVPYPYRQETKYVATVRS
jgi:hypothetical protein